LFEQREGVDGMGSWLDVMSGWILMRFEGMEWNLEFLMLAISLCSGMM